MKEQPQHPEPILSPEEQERVKLSICHFFENKLNELEANAGSNPSGYVQQFYELCSGSTEPWTRKKEFDLLGLAVPLRIRFDQHGGYQPKLRKMSINITPLLQARSANELKEAGLSVLETVHHESEHIFFPGEL